MGTYNYKALVALAFTGSVGMTMLILACALPSYGTWYPFINVVFYMLALPLILIVRNSRDAMSSIQWSACGLTLLANVVVFGTIIGFFVSFSGSDSDYSTW
ncbi:leptin receptor gene-related protein isoform X2 [Galendromus occidentalis]|uniref:Leptin receptor gene-related protein isoform X2 n=1 Tax=Galendromus occidentalis TaxID=34638 RepID=A0AAJ6QJW5_9ACAR|nr:leptin receptor gene-related protein isoform X2 [Galendromus occidentalis]